MGLEKTAILIGKLIVYFDDSAIVAEVIGDKDVKFEDKVWKLSPLTREIELLHC